MGGSWWQQLGSAFGTAVTSFEEYTQHAISSIGFSFSGIEQLIQIIGENGLNPTEVIPMLAGRASARGADPMRTLEEVAWGFVSQGPVGYASNLLKTKVVQPIQTALEQHE
jgi:hypothetical protein